jgi:hypothetical protein
MIFAKFDKLEFYFFYAEITFVHSFGEETV